MQTPYLIPIRPNADGGYCVLIDGQRAGCFDTAAAAARAAARNDGIDATVEARLAAQPADSPTLLMEVCRLLQAILNRIEDSPRHAQTETFDVAQAARELGVCRETVRRLARKKTGDARLRKVRGIRALRFERDEIYRFKQGLPIRPEW